MNLIDLLIDDEGIRLKVYDDATGKPIGPGDKLIGHPTIGIGRALDVNGITPAEARYLALNDIARVTAEAVKEFSWFTKLTPNRQCVVLSMIFNLGMNGFKEFKEMISSIKFGDFESATAEMLDSKWARDQVRERAHELATMMRDG